MRIIWKSYLGVFVDEHESVGDIVVAQVDDRGADPVADALLAAPQDGMHEALHVWGLLHAVQALAGVRQPVRVALLQEIQVAGAPQLEHVMADLPPQRQ